MKSMITNASLDAIEEALDELGFSTNRTNYSLIGRYGGAFKTNGSYLIIQVEDDGDKRHLTETLETGGVTWWKPKSLLNGKLDQVINLAESKEPKQKTSKTDSNKNFKKTVGNRFCEECGAKLSSTAKFCPSCGAKVHR